MPRKPLALDQMVDFLAQEDQYWCRVIDDPKSWSDKKQQTANAKERHLQKRRRLSHYRDRSQDHDRRSESCNVWDLDSEYTEESDENLGDKFVTVDLGRKQTCKQCGHAKVVNKSCSLQVCKSCCSDSTQECRLTDHKRSKKLGMSKPYLDNLLDDSAQVLPGVFEKITQAIQEKFPVYISYTGGTHSNLPRKIQLLQLVTGKTGGQKAISHCFLVNASRDFYLHKIQRIEDQDWLNESQGTVQAQCVFHFHFTKSASRTSLFSNLSPSY
jgi:hypothetical protein